MYKRITILVILLTWFGCDQQSSNETAQSPSENKRHTSQRSSPSGQNNAIDNYLNAPNAATREASIVEAKASLIDLSQDELSAIIVRNGHSSNINDRVFAAIALDVLFAKNPRLALDVYSGTDGLAGGAGQSFLHSAISSDSNLVVEWASSADLTNLRHIIMPLMTAFARTNPDLIMPLIASHQTTGLSSMMIDRLFAALPGSATDAVALASRHLKGDLVDLAFLTIARRHAANHPLDALEVLAQMNDVFPAEKNRIYKSVFESLTSKDPEQLVAAMENLEPGALQGALSSKITLQQLIKSDTSTAIALLDKLVMTPHNAETFKSAAFMLSQLDAEFAFDWVDQLHSSQTKNDMLSTSCRIWSMKSPWQVVEVIGNLNGLERSAALEGLAIGWATRSIQDFEEAVAWSNGLPDGDKKTFLENGFSRFSSHHPENAAALLNQSFLQNLEPNVARGAVVSTTRNLAAKSIVEAQSWMAGIPAAHQPAAARGLVMEWIKFDAQGASSWLSNLPTGSVRNAGAEVLANRIQSTDPELAQQWRDSITP